MGCTTSTGTSTSRVDSHAHKLDISEACDRHPQVGINRKPNQMNVFFGGGQKMHQKRHQSYVEVFFCLKPSQHVPPHWVPSLLSPSPLSGDWPLCPGIHGMFLRHLCLVACSSRTSRSSGTKNARDLVDVKELIEWLCFVNSTDGMMKTCYMFFQKIPIGSMYGIFTYIWLKFMLNVRR